MGPYATFGRGPPIVDWRIVGPLYHLRPPIVDNPFHPIPGFREVNQDAIQLYAAAKDAKGVIDAQQKYMEQLEEEQREGKEWDPFDISDDEEEEEEEENESEDDDDQDDDGENDGDASAAKGEDDVKGGGESGESEKEKDNDDDANCPSQATRFPAT